MLLLPCGEELLTSSLNYCSLCILFTIFHIRNLINGSIFIVCRPFTNLDTVMEISRTHDCAIFPEPLLVTGGEVTAITWPLAQTDPSL